MAAKLPSFLELFFTRTVRVRKDAIHGSAIGEDGIAVEIIKAGENRKILTSGMIPHPCNPAQNLIIEESAIHATSENAEAIKAAKERIAARAESKARTEKNLAENLARFTGKKVA